MMRAAEAMILGSTLIRGVPYTTDDSHGGGCALGMIGAATGRQGGWWMDHSKLWSTIQKIPCPCVSAFGLTTPFGGRVVPCAGAVAHLYNEHVHGDHTWTLEQLADWVESVDPTPRECDMITTPSVEAEHIPAAFGIGKIGDLYT